MENWGIFIAGGSLAVAIIALVFTLRSVKLQQVHNQNSIKPVCFIRAVDIVDVVRVAILNQGNGPMLITKLVLINTENASVAENIRDILSEKIAKKTEGRRMFTTAVTKDRVLRVGEELSFVSLKFSENVDENEFNEIKDQLRKELRNITVKIEYECLYGLKMCYEKNLHSSYSWRETDMAADGFDE
jgi:hypothetical protein